MAEPRDATGDEALVWVCTRCNSKLDGNPRWCPRCGYTVYRPTWEKPMAADEALLADLRRVAAIADPPPPVTARPSARIGNDLPCCDLHNRCCEPPGDLCCRHCTEAAHPVHLDGSTCVIGAGR